VATEGLLTINASSWLWIFLPVSNLEGRTGQRARGEMPPRDYACNIPSSVAALAASLASTGHHSPGDHCDTCSQGEAGKEVNMALKGNFRM
jgi:hypothetical protein